jgi:putative FmdB family regulatory protein
LYNIKGIFMPIYDCNCINCGIIEDVWAKINDINPKCPNCNSQMERLLSPTRVILDISPYFDENLADPKKSPHGQWVMSRQDKKSKLKEQGLVESG